ncbi:bifunctional serine/threonine-protein kinase/formylglycine-generating enzyme family protein [Alcanivorax sp.]|uniref:bifunctional serine/threonine-protein kinase/formylglycine-generating enzyme family protein n=1 Tax=Alcanivorax sp. TaxID=1872427 RepID=UPI0026150ED8|nr:bifunctional serine/threonine-protein kinase/formylglycine-generating enzyme family protein [Alcanivorax sp.]
MDKLNALKTLGLGEDASAEDIQAALKAKQQDIEEKKANAPTEALKAKFESLEAKLAEAEKVLSADPGRSQPWIKSGAGSAGDNASRSEEAKQTNPSPLSQTKLADLPGMASQDAAQVALQPGQVIANRYEIKKLIGQGGMGAVYRAHDKNTDRDLALKLLLPSLLKNDSARERFLSEAKISQQLSHPHIVNVYDVQSEGNLYFLTMELLEGQDLRQWLENLKTVNQPTPIDEVKRIASELCDALSYAHEFTVHRDIKPENIWLDESGKVKLMDFGIARVQSASQRTQTGAAMGTAYYMAPEQLQGRELDARADIYAIGVMLYEMLTGQIPAGRFEPAITLRKEIGKPLSAIIDKALSVNPEQRFANAAELKTALQSGKAGKVAKVKSARPASAANLHGSGPNKWVIAAALVLLVGFGGAVGLGVIDLSGLMPMSAAEKAQKEAAIARLQGEIKVLKQRLENGRRNLDSDLRDEERNNGKDLTILQSWQLATERAIFNGSKIGELEGTQSMAETLLRKQQYAQSEAAFIEVKAGYEKLNNEFQAGEKLLAADWQVQLAKGDWEDFKKKYGFTGQSPSAKQAQQEYDAAKQKRGSGELAASLPLFQRAKENWSAAKQAPEVVAWVKEKDAERAAAAEKKRKEAAAGRAAAEKARIAKLTGRLVSIPGRNFRMQEHEVTFAQWDACVKAGDCSHKPGDNGWGRGNRPVINVNWDDITQQFIPWLNKVTGHKFRLPTEAEWRYAARAGSTTKYSWGDSIRCSQARYGRRRGGECSNSEDGSVPVKGFSPNKWDLYDMHGNVWEWTQSCGDGGCQKRVLRGGSWAENPSHLQLVVRSIVPASVRVNHIGFRLVKGR